MVFLLAAYSGHVSKVETLICESRFSIDQNASRATGTALFLAVERGHTAIIETLLKHDVDVDDLVQLPQHLLKDVIAGSRADYQREKADREAYDEYMHQLKLTLPRSDLDYYEHGFPVDRDSWSCKLSSGKNIGACGSGLKSNIPVEGVCRPSLKGEGPEGLSESSELFLTEDDIFIQDLVFVWHTKRPAESLSFIKQISGYCLRLFIVWDLEIDDPKLSHNKVVFEFHDGSTVCFDFAGIFGSFVFTGSELGADNLCAWLTQVCETLVD